MGGVFFSLLFVASLPLLSAAVPVPFSLSGDGDDNGGGGGGGGGAADMFNFFGDFLNSAETLCTNASSVFGPSWCSFRNPLVVPLFSTSALPGVRFGDTSRGPRRFCEEDGKCSPVTHLATVEFGRNTTEVYKESVTVKRAIVSALRDGRVLLADFNDPDGDAPLFASFHAGTPGENNNNNNNNNNGPKSEKNDSAPLSFLGAASYRSGDGAVFTAVVDNHVYTDVWRLVTPQSEVSDRNGRDNSGSEEEEPRIFASSSTSQSTTSGNGSGVRVEWKARVIHARDGEQVLLRKVVQTEAHGLGSRRPFATVAALVKDTKTHRLRISIASIGVDDLVIVGPAAIDRAGAGAAIRETASLVLDIGGNSDASALAGLDFGLSEQSLNLSTLTDAGDADLDDVNAYNRLLVWVSDERQVSLFGLPSTTAGDPGAPVTADDIAVPFQPGSAQPDPSVFFRANASQRITAAEVFMEGLFRYSFDTKEGVPLSFLDETLSTLMWVAVGIEDAGVDGGGSSKDGPEKTFRIVAYQLPEFGDVLVRRRHGSCKDDAPAILVRNAVGDPALRDCVSPRGVPWRSCDPGVSYLAEPGGTGGAGAETAACAPRVVMSKPLGDRALQVRHRFRGIAEVLLPFINVYYCGAFCMPLLAQGKFNAYVRCTSYFKVSCPPNPYLLVGAMTPTTIFLRSSLSQFLASELFVRTATARVEISAVQQRWGTLTDSTMHQLNSIDHIGTVIAMEPSPNGQHLFAAVSRPAWALESTARFAEICAVLDADPGNAFLEAYAASCNGTRPEDRVLGVHRFVQHSSLCTPGTLCQSLDYELVTVVDPPFYSGPRVTFKRECPAGSFCPQGTEQRCPIGRVCPAGSPMPIACHQAPGFGHTCYAEGLVEPAVCPEGTVCLAPYFPPTPAPPGHYVAAGSGERLPVSGAVTTEGGLAIDSLPPPPLCELGDWCALGRSNSTDMRCPTYTACPSADVVSPTVCPFEPADNYASFCPAGSSRVSPCPAGFYCTSPDTRTVCPRGTYCGAGTLLYVTCPAGWYCPTPAEKIICPGGHFCRDGATRPDKCPWLTPCPRGTKDIKRNVLGPMLDLMALAVAFVLGRWYLRVRDQRRMERESERERLLTTGTGGGSDSGSDGEIGGGGDGEMVELGRMGRGMSKGNSDNKLQVPLLDDGGEEDDVGGGVDGVEPGERMDISFVDLTLTLSGAEGRRVLDRVSGELPSGTSTAVLGSSGAGKSSFLAALTGKAAAYGAVTGNVKINGRSDNLGRYRALVGFVPQEDVMTRAATVKEVLQFAAATRLPASMGQAERHRRVNAVIRTLGLWHVRHSVIGDDEDRGISGGQRKRVNIGIELVAMPTVLFLDEPTSGLDSKSTRDVVRALRSIAEAGLTVAAVVHQPSYESLLLFHRVILLGTGGRIVYHGPTDGALPYFNSLGYRLPPMVAPPDYFMDVLGGEAVIDGETSPTPLPKLFAMWDARGAAVLRGEQIPATTSTEAAAATVPSTAGASGEVSNTGGSSVNIDINGGGISSTNGAQIIEAAHPPPRPEGPLVDPRRVTPNVLVMIWLTVRRSLSLQFKKLHLALLDVSLVFVAGLFLGIIWSSAKYRGPPPKQLSDMCPEPLRPLCELPAVDPVIQSTSMTILALGLTCVMSSLRVFGSARAVFWREAAATSRSFEVAHFVGSDLAWWPTLLITPAIYLTIFYSLTSPRATLMDYYTILLNCAWAASGLAYIVSIVVPPGLNQLAGVVLLLILMSVSGANPTLSQLDDMHLGWFALFSYIRWAQEALYVVELQNFSGLYHIQVSMDLFRFHHTGFPMFVVFLMGAIFRAVALVALLLTHRNKKR